MPQDGPAVVIHRRQGFGGQEGTSSFARDATEDKMAGRQNYKTLPGVAFFGRKLLSDMNLTRMQLEQLPLSLGFPGTSLGRPASPSGCSKFKVQSWTTTRRPFRLLPLIFASQ